MIENSIEFMELLFGAAKLGAITVPINYRLSASEVAYILTDSGATVLLTSTPFTPLVETASKEKGVVLRYILQVVAKEPRNPFWHSLEELLATQPISPFDSDVSESDIAAIMYTSGTTGRPKGAMLTHANFLWNVVNFMGSGVSISSSDITVTAAPMFHIGGLGVFTLPLVYLGGCSYILSSFTPETTLAAISQERATVIFLVPAMWAAIAQSDLYGEYDLSSLRAGMSGGSPCPLTIIEYFQSQGLTFQEGFGMTETAPGCTLLAPEYVKRKAGSIGRPLMHVETRVVDEQDKDVFTSEVGELLLRGPNLFTGYWCLPQETAAAFQGGWFHTGDLAKVDDEGFITLVDRKKDMIISGGENIYPIEVEQVLFRHPHIADVGVIGLPDPKWGEAVVAVVVPQTGKHVKEEDVIAFAHQHLGGFKCPKRVFFVDSLPRNATGKLLKGVMREKFGGTTEAFER